VLVLLRGFGSLLNPSQPSTQNPPATWIIALILPDAFSTFLDMFSLLPDLHNCESSSEEHANKQYKCYHL